MERPRGIIRVLYLEGYSFDTLHKKPCRIGPGLCGTSENDG
jgi:hypothetical protein